MFPPGFEPGTFRVLGERDNHYTTETLCWTSEPLTFSQFSSDGAQEVPQTPLNRPGIGQRREWASHEAGENPTTGPPMLGSMSDCCLIAAPISFQWESHVLSTQVCLIGGNTRNQSSEKLVWLKHVTFIENELETQSNKDQSWLWQKETQPYKPPRLHKLTCIATSFH